MTSTEIINKLNAMKDELMARGWGKNRLENEDNGHLCLLGARNVVVLGRSMVEESMDDGNAGYFEDELSNALIEALTQKPVWKEKIDESESLFRKNTAHIYTFNDFDSTEFNDVLDLIDEAIIIQKEKE